MRSLTECVVSNCCHGVVSLLLFTVSSFSFSNSGISSCLVVVAHSKRSAAQQMSARIVIQRAEGEGEVPKYVMLELQGTVETREGMEETAEIGVVAMERGGTMPVLTIGRSCLEGEVVKLHNPLLVIQKDQQQATTTRHRVVGVVREKYLFRHRPHPK